ncbi:MAG: HD domain-containing phosphohydrolase, partial [Planctomycetota bacterium]
LFLDSLRRSFGQTSRPSREGPERDIFAARRRSQQAGRWELEGSPMPVNEWLRGLLDRAEQRRTVIVEPAPPWHCSRAVAPNDIAEVMIAPLISGDVLVCSLVLLRTEKTPVFRASEMMLIESLTTFCGDLIRSHRLVGELREMSLAMVRALVNAVDQKDEYTCGHSLRVAYYATTLGQRLGLGDVDLQMLQWASLLHDVGKIGIRDNVLKKEGKLTPEEFGHIQEHPVRSHKVVQEVPQLLQALDGILHHHERYDGSGYPAGLKGEQIPYQARIIQIADVFDALTSNRSYRKAFDWRRALGILQEEAGKTVDPRLQKTFDALLREKLKDDPTAWERMVEHANRFMQGLDAIAAEPVGE